MNETVSRLRREALTTAWKVFIGAIVTALIAGATLLASGAWSNLVAIWNLPADSEQHSAKVQAQLEALSAQIEALQDNQRRQSLPEEIFMLSARSGPLDGACIEGVPCDMLLAIRRFQDAIECRLIPSSLKYFYLNPRTDQESGVEVLAGSPRNVGTRPVNLFFTFSTPRGLAPDALFCSSASYRHCRGQLPKDNDIEDVACIDVDVEAG